MDNETQELTPDELAQSEKRKEQNERKQLKKQALRDKPPKSGSNRFLNRNRNSRFLARPWITLPEVDETLTQHRVRVMTWNVRTAVYWLSLVETNFYFQLLAQSLVRTLVKTACIDEYHSWSFLRPRFIPNQ